MVWSNYMDGPRDNVAELAVDIIVELVRVGADIYAGVRAGQTQPWTPIIDRFSPELQSRIYHEAREAQVRARLTAALDTEEKSDG